MLAASVTMVISWISLVCSCVENGMLFFALTTMEKMHQVAKKANSTKKEKYLLLEEV